MCILGHDPTRGIYNKKIYLGQNHVTFIKYKPPTCVLLQLHMFIIIIWHDMAKAFTIKNIFGQNHVTVIKIDPKTCFYCKCLCSFSDRIWQGIYNKKICTGQNRVPFIKMRQNHDFIVIVYVYCWIWLNRTGPWKSYKNHVSETD